MGFCSRLQLWNRFENRQKTAGSYNWAVSPWKLRYFCQLFSNMQEYSKNLIFQSWHIKERWVNFIAKLLVFSDHSQTDRQTWDLLLKSFYVTRLQRHRVRMYYTFDINVIFVTNKKYFQLYSLMLIRC